jgi:hypothetical protein
MKKLLLGTMVAAIGWTLPAPASAWTSGSYLIYMACSWIQNCVGTECGEHLTMGEVYQHLFFYENFCLSW